MNEDVAEEMYCKGLALEGRGNNWVAAKFFYRAAKSRHLLAKNKVLGFLDRLKPENACDVFISYRRDGGLDFARLIYLELKCRGYNVFFDYSSLRSGKFDEEILNAIRNCKFVVSVVTEGCFDRCQEESDWVRKELAYAFANGKDVLAAERYNSKTTWPSDLPQDIAQLLSVPRLMWDPDDSVGLDLIDKKYFRSLVDDLDRELLGCPNSSTEGVVGDYTHPDEGFDHCVFRVFVEMIRKELDGGTNKKFQKERGKMSASSIFGEDL